ncbi:hypothetical protein Vretimale_17815 [Volvox reticuliferus]|uniref:Uncharacterized protein n=2 Tax=Volvox reticuliferus TaxID=1737510 RepID=A0A8J4GX92_9CHLO|nr:hypothetical protein Vretifemale_19052 [Volvox reticuliferus]GIM14969.1 hypothetical protein Vretimale_17815 [Volvox reticuliferus]
MESESRMFFSPVVMLYFQSDQQPQNVIFSSVLQMNSTSAPQPIWPSEMLLRVAAGEKWTYVHTYRCTDVQMHGAGGERAGGIGTHHRADFIVPSFSRWELSLSMESESRMFFSPVVMLYFQSDQQPQNVIFSSVLQMNSTSAPQPIWPSEMLLRVAAGEKWT